MHNSVRLELFRKIKVHQRKLLISGLWLLGIIAGYLFAINTPWSVISAASITNSTCKPGNGLLVMLSTLLIGYLTCIYCNPLFYGFLFIKGLIYANISVNIWFAFGSAGWLAELLLLSADAVAIFVVLLFAFYNIEQGRKEFLKNTLLFAFVSAVVIIMELCVTIPFSNSLLNG